MKTDILYFQLKGRNMETLSELKKREEELLHVFPRALNPLFVLNELNKTQRQIEKIEKENKNEISGRYERI